MLTVTKNRKECWKYVLHQRYLFMYNPPKILLWRFCVYFKAPYSHFLWYFTNQLYRTVYQSPNSKVKFWYDLRYLNKAHSGSFLYAEVHYVQMPQKTFRVCYGDKIVPCMHGMCLVQKEVFYVYSCAENCVTQRVVTKLQIVSEILKLLLFDDTINYDIAKSNYLTMCHAKMCVPFLYYMTLPSKSTPK